MLREFVLASRLCVIIMLHTPQQHAPCLELSDNGEAATMLTTRCSSRTLLLTHYALSITVLMYVAMLASYTPIGTCGDLALFLAVECTKLVENLISI